MLGYALCGTYPCVVVKIQFSSVQIEFIGRWGLRLVAKERARRLRLQCAEIIRDSRDDRARPHRARALLWCTLLRGQRRAARRGRHDLVY